ncbi:MAG: GTP cyclohydrolase II [Pseudomonadota bacterium]
MFTYLNPDVRKRLIAEKKLIRIDARGQKLPEAKTADPAELVINLMGPIPLPLQLSGGNYQAEWYVAVRRTELRKVEELAATLRHTNGQDMFANLATSMAVNSVLIFGDPDKNQNPLVRVHSNCMTGDVFGSQRCECGPQLASAAERINSDPSGGIIVYMAGHEGRGIGLWAKAATYLLQDAGEDTYQANESLGLPADSRDFSEAAALIHYFLGNRAMRILTNNPKKIADLQDAGLTEFSVEKHVTGVNHWNKRYLSAKQSRGHQIEDDDIEKM